MRVSAAAVVLTSAFGTVIAASDAELAACTSSYEAYLARHSDLIEDCPLGGGTAGEYRSKCPPGMQALIDSAYADCGGLVVDRNGVGGIDWDSEVGGTIKYEVEKCGCSRGAGTAPAIAALVLLSWLPFT